jgi:uncharacterized protein YndB with AHSA1/START domain
MTLVPPSTAQLRRLTVARIVDASAARVYAAFTEAALLARWMAPPPYVIRECVTDPRPGGSYRVAIEGPEGDRHLTTGEFLELVPERRVVQSWRYEGTFGRDEVPTIVTVELRPLGPDVTELTLTHARLPAAEHYEHVEAGWEECLAALAALLDDGTLVQVRVERRLDAAPERAFDAFVDPAVLGAWMGGTGELLRGAADARPGGAFTLVVRRESGEVAHEGEYLVLDRPRRIAFTWRLPQLSPDADLVSVDLVPDGDGCALTLVHRMGAQWAEHRGRVASAWETLCDAVAAASTHH